MIQSYSFAQPGLLPSERRAFVVWMVLIWAIAMISLILTVTEFLIIQSLIENPGVVKSREQLMSSAFGLESKEQDDRAIDHHLKRIRKKIKKSDSKFNSLNTIYGIGYKFSE